MANMDVLNNIREAASFIRGKIDGEPEIGLILGSGLGIIAELVENPVVIAYENIPHFPVSTVEGHAGELVVGTVAGRRVILMKGRFHLYEGYPVEVVSFPVRVMKELGVKKLVVTNAAGGINTSYEVGDLMLIKDHINFTFRNPLIGPNLDELGPRFPDMSEAYSKRLRQIAREVAESQGVKLQEGVYIGLLGPSYETTLSACRPSPR
jgi:purine-nucleoside phosphorylase